MLLVTTFITGASVLVIEIIGSRVLAPFFGSGVYTWSALIAVTLGALALGYTVGGRLVDRLPRPNILYSICLIAGLWTIMTPWLAGITLPSLVKLADTRMGVLLACCLLFIPNLFLLGTVCPFVIRLLSNNNTTPGSISGRVFSISTFGSLLAALLTGFALVPNFGVQQILYLCGVTLILLAVTGFVLLRTKSGVIIALAFLVITAFIQTSTTKTSTANLEILDSKSGFYGQLHVVRKHGIKTLLVDGIGQNYVMEDGAYTTPYINFMASIPQLHQISARKVTRNLVIGIGAGQLPMLLKHSGHQVTGVEIDPLVVEMANKYFDFDMQKKNIHITDGRLFLARNTDSYDYIFIDAFNADQIAWHLLSKESLELSRQHITEQGMLIINMTSSLSGKDVASLQLTLQAVFPHVKTFSGDQRNGFGSIIFLASSSAIHLSQDKALLSDSQLADTQNFMASELGTLDGGILLTDNYNPISQQRVQIELHWRNSMREFLGEKEFEWLFL